MYIMQTGTLIFLKSSYILKHVRSWTCKPTRRNKQAKIFLKVVEQC